MLNGSGFVGGRVSLGTCIDCEQAIQPSGDNDGWMAPGAPIAPGPRCWDCATAEGWSVCRNCITWAETWHAWEIKGDGPYCDACASIPPEGCDCDMCGQ